MADPPASYDRADAALVALFEGARDALCAPVLELDPNDSAHACAIGALEMLRLLQAEQGEMMDDATAVRATADRLDALVRYARRVARDAA